MLVLNQLKDALLRKADDVAELSLLCFLWPAGGARLYYLHEDIDKYALGISASVWLPRNRMKFITS